MLKKPTVVLIVNHGWTIRNFLLSDFYKTLSKSCDIILCTNLNRDDLLRINFENNPTIKLFDFEYTWLHERISMRKATYHNLMSDSETQRIKLMRFDKQRSGIHKIRVGLELYIIKKIINLFGNKFLFSMLDRLDRWLSNRNPVSEKYRKIFKKLNPNLVFSTFSVIKQEHCPLYVAQKMKIKTVVNVASWDNITSKGRLPFGCDNYIVWSKHMKREVAAYHKQIDKKDIIITGTPQYDFSLNKKLIKSKFEFCQSLGIDPDNRIILYAGCTQMPFEHKIVEDLIKRYLNGEIESNLNLIIRTHPQDSGERYLPLIGKYPEIIFQIPGLIGKGDGRRLIRSIKDMETIVNTTHHSDVHINVASTMSLDAAVLDKPVIGIMYDKKPDHMPISSGIETYNYTHYKTILQCNGIKIAHSEDELVNYIRAYLNDPSMDRNGRKNIVKKICGNVDGNASLRIANQIKKIAHS